MLRQKAIRAVKSFLLMFLPLIFMMETAISHVDIFAVILDAFAALVLFAGFIYDLCAFISAVNLEHAFGKEEVIEAAENIAEEEINEAIIEETTQEQR